MLRLEKTFKVVKSPLVGPLHRAVMAQGQILQSVGQSPATPESGYYQATGQYLHQCKRSGHPQPEARLALTGQESLCQLSSASGAQDTLQDTSDSSCDSCHKHVTWPWVYSVLPSRSLALCTSASKIFIFQQTSLQRGNKFLTMTFGCSEFFFHS